MTAIDYYGVIGEYDLITRKTLFSTSPMIITLDCGTCPPDKWLPKSYRGNPKYLMWGPDLGKVKNTIIQIFRTLPIE